MREHEHHPSHHDEHARARPRAVARPAHAAQPATPWRCSAGSGALAAGRLRLRGRRRPAPAAATRRRAPPATTARRGATGHRDPRGDRRALPGDGSNGLNVLTESGIVRSDITTQLRLGVGRRGGRAADHQAHGRSTRRNGCAPLAGAAVYLWHCDREGRYSMYSEGVADENYLRGVQETDADGTVTFTSIFPAAYSGRWPHIHFEVYPSLDDGDHAPATSCAPRSSRCPRTPATRSTPPPATSRASRTWRRPRSTPTWSSATATRSSSPRSPARCRRG